MCGAMQGQGQPEMQQPKDSMLIAGIPPGGMMGFTEDQLHRRKALQDIINDPATDSRTLRNAQRQWILMQQGKA